MKVHYHEYNPWGSDRFVICGLYRPTVIDTKDKKKVTCIKCKKLMNAH